jgi:hypothetical protein
MVPVSHTHAELAKYSEQKTDPAQYPPWLVRAVVQVRAQYGTWYIQIHYGNQIQASRLEYKLYAMRAGAGQHYRCRYLQLVSGQRY